VHERGKLLVILIGSCKKGCHDFRQPEEKEKVSLACQCALTYDLLLRKGRSLDASQQASGVLGNARRISRRGVEEDFSESEVAGGRYVMSTVTRDAGVPALASQGAQKFHHQSTYENG